MSEESNIMNPDFTTIIPDEDEVAELDGGRGFKWSD